MSSLRRVALGEITSNFDSRRVPIKTSERRQGPYPYYGASGIIDSVEEYIFDGEYLLIAEDGENLRSRSTPIAFLAGGQFWVNNHAHVVQGNAQADTRFLAHLLSITEVSGYLTGSTQPKLTRRALDSIELNIPPLETQQAIAEVLGALDDKIAANTKLSATAHGLAALIYDQSTCSLGPVPMSTVVSPILGGTPPRSREDYWSGDQLWASAKDITGAEFSTVVNTDEKISLSAVEKTKAKPLPRGSVILTARGTVGAVARLAVPASFNQSCYGFVPGAVPPGVLYFAILQAMQRAKAIAHGSVFDTITMKTFDHLEFPDFAGTSMADTDAKIAPLLDTITAAVLENQRLASTRDALLPQLMSGKLRVKDAERVASTAV